MNIYVGNLSREVNEDDLRQAFEQFGEVKSVSIIKDRFSGESRGFGFIEMPSSEQAQAAIKQADGTDLKGRALRVNEAHARSKPAGGRRPSGRGGGGRGFGQGRGRGRY